MARDVTLRIAAHEPWMDEPLAELFAREYGRPLDVQRAMMAAAYDHPWQRERCIRVVALDGRRVVGFQSFFRWPCALDGEPVRAYQSGRSLIDPAYRGQRVFSRLLDHVEQTPALRERADCWLGFPIAVSYNSLSRRGWANVVDLAWYARPLGLRAALREPRPGPLPFDPAPRPVRAAPRRGFTLAGDTAFEQWRAGIYAHRSYGWFHHDEGGERVRFDLKLRRRGRLHDLTIGRVTTSASRVGLVARGLRALCRRAGRGGRFNLVSVATNRGFHDPTLVRALPRAGFARLRRPVFFMALDERVGLPLHRPELWDLGASDIDTW